MIDNPTVTLPRRTRVAITFCLAEHPKTAGLICTRIDDHNGHCCDEIAGESWSSRRQSVNCRQHYDHSAEKGLVRA